MRILNNLQLRELFHLEFLRWLSKKLRPVYYVLKGGVNMRFFFNSFRYSEDMYLDIGSIKIVRFQDLVMDILKDNEFENSFKPFGVEEVIPPDITEAKQTKTTQRFKVHLLTASGEDLFTKVECSRRGFDKNKTVEPVSEKILRTYKTAPVLASHYGAVSTCKQKINALAKRNIIQARDIFDLYILNTQIDLEDLKNKVELPENKYIKTAYDNIFTVNYCQFRDSVLSYLSDEEQQVYSREESWDEIKLKVANLIEELLNE